ncbi:glycoside hydrolase family 30 beta sandwich domain-containing protein [Haoranjiania flava]|uniref:Glucosylceramidase n=1 Tax=Haoranjiania flava TaxID=1856322 RepID=A0AAE3LJ96_9BACT|nr:glycoside hydrolase family 30 beta sandwich domain-containing protein [Haoranjiania flava]MCU7693388.1 hypothetical protein [Haoranjiania flava]
MQNIAKMTMSVLAISLSFLYSFCSPGSKQGIDKPDTSKPDPVQPVEVYVTTATQSMLFKKINLEFNKKDNLSPYTVTLDPTQQYQQIDGFGAAFTGSTCYNLLKMNAANRKALLTEVFDTREGMGYSFIRIALGCSDFSLSEYSYCDKPGMENFALHEEDTKYVIPVLKEILAINPKVKIMASPWTPPLWMKVNNLKELKPHNKWNDGQLNPSNYQDYASYFVKYINAMKNNGIDIYAVTVQNEPLNRGNSASLYMTWQEQRDFIKTALGPAFKTAGINTRIISYDHNYDYDSHKPENADQIHYPAKIYEDPDAAKYIDGAAYHAYGGSETEMDYIHNAFPDKNLYFTEISIGLWGYTFAEDLMWNLEHVGIGTLNRHCKAVIVWNFMLDEQHGPNRPGGCTNCLGVIDINKADYTTLTRNSHYYDLAHLSKVIQGGAKRIKTSGFTTSGLHYTAVLNPDNTVGVVVLNTKDEPQSITLAMDGRSLSYSLPAKSVASFKWKK